MDGIRKAPDIPAGARAAALAGVWTHGLSVIPATGGPVLHMLRSDSPLFSGFGEMYFSEVEPGAVKGWKRHREQSQTFAVPVGRVEFIVYDGREGSPSSGVVERFVLGRPDKYTLLHIPPGLWYAFAGRSEAPSLIANLADMPHRPEESDRLPLDAPEMPCRWKP